MHAVYFYDYTRVLFIYLFTCLLAYVFICLLFARFSVFSCFKCSKHHINLPVRCARGAFIFKVNMQGLLFMSYDIFDKQDIQWQGKKKKMSITFIWSNVVGEDGLKK